MEKKISNSGLEVLIEDGIIKFTEKDYEYLSNKIINSSVN